MYRYTVQRKQIHSIIYDFLAYKFLYIIRAYSLSTEIYLHESVFKYVNIYNRVHTHTHTHTFIYIYIYIYIYM